MKLFSLFLPKGWKWTEKKEAYKDNIFSFCSLVMIFQEKQGGQVGLVVDCEWAEANSDKIEDISATARRLDFQIGW